MTPARADTGFDGSTYIAHVNAALYLPDSTLFPLPYPPFPHGLAASCQDVAPTAPRAPRTYTLHSPSHTLLLGRGTSLHTHWARREAVRYLRAPRGR